MNQWSQEDVYNTGQNYFECLKKDLSRARESIDLEIYTFASDTLGRAIVDELNRASLRGIEVRVMVDGFGTRLYDLHYLSSHLASKIKFKIFHPVPWKWPVFKSFSHFVKSLFRVNHRNHRKTCIIDRTILWVGSMNISVKHLVWRDMGVRVLGKKGARFKRRLCRGLIRRIETAKDRIWITNAYFVPTLSLVRALKRAAKNGVDVRVIVPRTCDVFFIPLVRAIFYGSLLESGVKIFEFLPTMLHAKTLLVDDWVILGSSNLNHRSLNLDLEADVVLTHLRSRMKLEEQFISDTANSSEVTVEDLKKRTWFQSRSGQALLLLKNWM